MKRKEKEELAKGVDSKVFGDSERTSSQRRYVDRWPRVAHFVLSELASVLDAALSN
jgi:hypothetical protein